MLAGRLILWKDLDEAIEGSPSEDGRSASDLMNGPTYPIRWTLSPPCRGRLGPYEPSDSTIAPTRVGARALSAPEARARSACSDLDDVAAETQRAASTNARLEAMFTAPNVEPNRYRMPTCQT